MGKQATEDDWHAEYLDLILAVRAVSDVHAAIEHINRYGSPYSDAIIASNEKAQTLFTDEVDSAPVYVNASTRFTSGGEFGMNADINTNTNKLHARGPTRSRRSFSSGTFGRKRPVKPLLFQFGVRLLLLPALAEIAQVVEASIRLSPLSLEFRISDPFSPNR